MSQSKMQGKIGQKPFKLIRWILVLGILVGMFNPLSAAQAETWYVRQEAAPGGDGTSWHTAFNNLQDAIDAATSWDDIWVKKGTYLLVQELSMTGTERLYGGFEGLISEAFEDRDWRANPTVIDGQSSLRGISISGLTGGDGAVVDGFTIQNCRHAGSGGAIYVGTGNSPIIRNCTFINNAAQEGVAAGGGVCIINDVGARIVGCIFTSNSAIQGGAVYGEICSPVIVNCVFNGNSAVNGGAIYHHNPDDGFPTKWNSASNCTFYKNTATNGGGIYITPATIYNIYNSIMWANSASSLGSQVYKYDAQFGANSSCFQGGPDGCYPASLLGDGTLTTANPKMLSPDYGDFRLRGSSTNCIDQGRNDAPYLDMYFVGGVDLAGEDRFTDGDEDGTGTPDMGAYEYLPGGPEYITWHVDGQQAEPGNGWSWDDSLNSISNAILRAISGDEIWVKRGVYTLSSQIGVNKSVHIYGGFDGTESSRTQRDPAVNMTTVNGSNSVTCFYIYGGSPTVDGFTVTNGNDGFDGGGFYIGGASPTISNCIVTANNGTSYGGGLFIEVGAAPVISYCQIIGNEANHGGGIYSEENSNITINNCILSGNSSIYRGGGIYIQRGTLTINNCTIAENEVTGNHSGGGICIYEAALNINGGQFLRNKAVYQYYGYGGAIDIEVNVNNSSHPAVNITDTMFSQNEAYYGGAISVNNGAGTLIMNLTGCEFLWNTAGRLGGAIYGLVHGGTHDSCIFIGNTAQESGGAISGGYVTMQNCLITDNQAFEYHGGGIATARSSLELINCTITNNHTPYYGGGIEILAGDSPTITNCIVWGNTAGQAGNGLYIDASSSPVITYCDLQDVYSGTGNISEDPGFVASTDGHLAAGSPCINTASDAVAPATDIEGSGRVGSADMGAYEYQGFDPVVLDYIEITGPTTIDEQSGAQFSCMAHYSDGSDQDVTNSVFWDENSPHAFFSGNGYLSTGDIPTPLNQTLIVSALYEYRKTEQTVTIVNANPVVDMEIFGPEYCPESSTTYYFCIATLEDDTAMDVTDLASWYSTYWVSARFNNPGVLSTYTVHQDLDLEITADYAGETGYHYATLLNGATFSGIEIDGPSEIFEDSSVRYDCTGNYSNGASEDFSAFVTWTDDSDYAAIDATGFLDADSVPADEICNLTADYQGTTDTHTVLIKKRPPADFKADFNLNYMYREDSGVDSFAASTVDVAPGWWLELANRSEEGGPTWLVDALTFQAPYDLLNMRPIPDEVMGNDYTWNSIPDLLTNDRFTIEIAEQNTVLESAYMPFDVSRSVVDNTISETGGQNTMATTVTVVPQVGIERFEVSIAVAATKNQITWESGDFFGYVMHSSVDVTGATPDGFVHEDGENLQEYTWSFTSYTPEQDIVFTCVNPIQLKGYVDQGSIVPEITVKGFMTTDAGSETWTGNTLTLTGAHDGGQVYISSSQALTGSDTYLRVLGIQLPLNNQAVEQPFAWSQDPSNNTPVVTADGDQDYFDIVRDNNGGYYVVWCDRRGGSNGYDIYAQHFDPDSKPLWGQNGKLVCDTDDDQYNPKVVLTENGVIVTWYDQNLIYGQRLDLSGSPMWGYNALLIFEEGDSSQCPVTDGAGGVIITDGMGSANRVSGNGALLWGDNANPVDYGPRWDAYDARIVSDDMGGAIVVWQQYDEGLGADVVKAQHLDGDGNLLWNGASALLLAQDVNNNAFIVPDALNGCVVAWMRYDNGHNLYAQRVGSDGALLWGVEGVQVNSVSELIRPSWIGLANDGQGGAYMTWIEDNYTQNLFAQKIDASGGKAWADSIHLTALEYERQTASDPRVTVEDGHGGFITTWANNGSWNMDEQRNDYDIIAQRMDSDGNVLWPDGIVVSDASDHQKYPQIISSGAGGAVVIWRDWGNSSDIYMQGVMFGGSLGNPSGSDLPGDVNLDFTVDVADAIAAVQILNGIDPAHGLNPYADINDDDKIGVEEVIYLLHYLAGLRDNS